MPSLIYTPPWKISMATTDIVKKRNGFLIPTRQRYRCKDYEEGCDTLDGVTWEPLKPVFYLSSETMQAYNANTVGKMLRERQGADPEVSDVAWERCGYMDAMDETLHAAVGSGNARLAAKRIAEGADPNSRMCATERSTYLITPLIRAVRCGYHKVAETLLDEGCDVNDHDYLNRTALFFAVIARDIKMVRLLLSKGADKKLEMYFTTPQQGGFLTTPVAFALYFRMSTDMLRVLDTSV
jgi:hypothetical protein